MISTNIVENGLDLPHVNTIIVYRSNLFSLATLYQLKGRVGRSSKRGYAYMTYKENELNDNILRAFHVPDAIIHPPKLFELLAKEIRAYGGKILTNHEVVSIKETNNVVNSIEFLTMESKQKLNVMVLLMQLVLGRAKWQN